VDEGSATALGDFAAVEAVRELRTGIVGAGFIGRVHARSARLAGARLAGIAASSPERSAEAARELGAATEFPGAEALIASEEIDVVHICAPNHLHVPLARAAIEAGKHVICEKPIAMDASGAAELLEAAVAADTVAAVPLVYRYYPTVREARARIRSGAAGEPRLLHGAYLQDWLLSADDDNWRVDPGLGGASRAFADIGSHWCDLVEFVSGQRITRLAARTAIAHPSRRRAPAASFERSSRASDAGEMRAVETEDVATLIFETDRGATGSAFVSQVSAGRKNRLWFEISTEEETLCFDQERPETLGVLRRESGAAIPRDFDTLAPEAAAYVTLPGGHPQGYHDCFDAFVAEAYEAITGASRADGLPGFEDGLRSARITEAVLEAARSNAWVEVAS
jgi:predicted dehydrogenase